VTVPGTFPGGARFAFTILDDTDDATEENVGPVYGLLRELGMRTTKTIWPVACPEGSETFFAGQTMDDPGYARFVLELAKQGFELAFHGATMETSTRERVEFALQRFRDIAGRWPRVHANHAHNRENLYWGVDRVDFLPVRLFYALTNGHARDWFQGHREGSRWWWGDLCRERIEYVRNLTFDEINLLNVNPTLPYRDPRRPLARWWFSATDAEDAAAFNHIVDETAQDRLEAQGGVCILATHLGKGYAKDGRVHPRTEALLRRLAAKGGWCPPVSELLDWLRGRDKDPMLPAGEWRRMQVLWARDLVRRRLRPPPPLEWAA
jgi:hypothetical protein